MRRAALTPRRLLLAGGAAAAALIALVVLLAAGRGSDGYWVEAEFRDAGGIRVHSDVRAGGVRVGEVARIDVTPRDTARVRLRVDEDAARVGRGAVARARPSGNFGDRFIDLVPGDPDHPLPSGGRVARTDTSAELSDLLNMLEPAVRTRLKVLLNELGVGLLGRGVDVGRALDRLPGGISEVRQLLDQIRSENRELGTLIERGDRVLAAAAAEDDELGRVVGSSATALEAVAGRSAALERTLGESPAALRQLRSTAARLAPASRAVSELSAQLRRTASPLTEVLSALPGFTRLVSPTLREARTVAPVLSRLGERATGTVRRAAGPARHLRVFTTELAPTTSAVDDNKENALGLVEGWARLMQTRDRIGHLFMTETVGSAELARALLPVPRAKGRKRRRGKDDDRRREAPAPSGEPAPRPKAPKLRPKLPVKPLLPLPGVPEVQAGVDEATDGVSSLLDFLLAP